jgi:hypothetical protein
MAFVDCLCPQATSLTAIPTLTCTENLGQIVKLAFQRRQTTAPFPTKVGAGAGDAGLLASWTTLKAAADSTKITVTPYAEAIVIPPLEKITEGGDDNSTLDGIPDVVGVSVGEATGNFRGLPAAILKVLKTLNCEVDMTVYLINEFGYIIGQSIGGVTFQGIEINNFFIADGGNEGKNTKDKTMFSWNYRYGWRDNLAIVKPTDFNGRNLS